MPFPTPSPTSSSARAWRSIAALTLALTVVALVPAHAYLPVTLMLPL
jgi:hypothetical protein